MIKKAIAVCALSLASFGAFSYEILGVTVPEEGLLKTGTQFLSTTAVPGEFVGIGEINQILDKDGLVAWQDGDNGTDLWFYFDDMVILPPDGTTVPTIGGELNFARVDAGAFAPGGNFAADTAALFGAAGYQPWADGSLTSVVTGIPAYPVATSISQDIASGGGETLTGTGWVDIVGGAAQVALDTDQIPNPYDAQLSDLELGFSVSNDFPVGEYGFTGSSDFRGFGRESQMPEAGTVLMLVLGLVLLVTATSQRKAPR